MRRSYNIPLNDNSTMDVSCSPQSGFMPNFLIGNNNNQNDFFLNQSKMHQPSIQNFLPFENKPLRASNLKRRESYHDASRKHGPPITSLRSRSPKNTYIKSLALTNDNSFYGNSVSTPGKLNQSIRSVKPYENYNKSNLNSSIKESDAYNSYLIKNEATSETENDYVNWVTVFGYAPSETRFVLSYFAEIGNIVDQKISNSGNWMHLQYESKMHAVAALNRNGRIINLNVMIGVKPCDDKIVDVPPNNRFKELSMTNRSDNLNTSRMVEEPLPINGSNSIPPLEKLNVSMMNTSMRSLNHSSYVSPVEAETRPKGSMLTRAMSMVFGRR